MEKFYELKKGHIGIVEGIATITACGTWSKRNLHKIEENSLAKERSHPSHSWQESNEADSSCRLSSNAVTAHNTYLRRNIFAEKTWRGRVLALQRSAACDPSNRSGQ